MDAERISISLDEVNSKWVDAEIRRQDIAARMAAHQEQVEAHTPPTRRFGGGFFRKAVVYMSVFGLAASIAAWGVGEWFQYKERHHPITTMESVVTTFLKNKPNASDWEFFKFLDRVREESPELRDNRFLTRSFFEQSKSIQGLEIEHARRAIERLSCYWYVFVGLLIGLGMAIAEPIVGHNSLSALLRGLLGACIGALGGFILSLFINDIYHFLGGGKGNPFIVQMFARGVGWSILGAFLAIAPGIAMRNSKKFLLGLAGGAVGGLLGGFLFDPICLLTESDIPARFVNIVGLGVGAAVATALLEEAAKQGWLKVATGVITGKQFILYRNPTVIGSSPKSEIYLFKDPTVAPKHAAINGIGGEFLLTALNGATVLLNGTPVRQQRLKNGDQIRVGNTVFLFGARSVKHH